jgi:carbon storage regulator
MQIISRCEGQAVIVGEQITVTILEIDGDEVVLQVDGPEDLTVYRSEDLNAVLAAVGFENQDSRNS